MISCIVPSCGRPEIVLGSILDLRNQRLFRDERCEALISLDTADPAFTRYRWLLGQASSILRQSCPSLSLILVKNETTGLVHAKNAAARLAKGEFLFFMDDDLYFEESYIAALVADLRRVPKAGAASGSIVSFQPAISHTQRSSRIRRPPKATLLQRVRLPGVGSNWKLHFGAKHQVMDWAGIRRSLHPSKRYDMEYFVNSFLLRRSAFRVVGGFDAQLNGQTSPHEEVELTIRIRSEGWRLLFNPHVAGWHITVASGGIYKGDTMTASRAILEREYRSGLRVLRQTISDAHAKAYRG